LPCLQTPLQKLHDGYQVYLDRNEYFVEEILKTVREHRSGRKKLPEITVVARTKKKTA
jgi:hypothetical protein